MPSLRSLDPDSVKHTVVTSHKRSDLTDNRGQVRVISMLCSGSVAGPRSILCLIFGPLGFSFSGPLFLFGEDSRRIHGTAIRHVPKFAAVEALYQIDLSSTVFRQMARFLATGAESPFKLFYLLPHYLSEILHLLGRANDLIVFDKIVIDRGSIDVMLQNRLEISIGLKGMRSYKKFRKGRITVEKRSIELLTLLTLLNLSEELDVCDEHKAIPRARDGDVQASPVTRKTKASDFVTGQHGVINYHLILRGLIPVDRGDADIFGVLDLNVLVMQPGNCKVIFIYLLPVWCDDGDIARLSVRVRA